MPAGLLLRTACKIVRLRGKERGRAPSLAPGGSFQWKNTGVGGKGPGRAQAERCCWELKLTARPTLGASIARGKWVSGDACGVQSSWLETFQLSGKYPGKTSPRKCENGVLAARIRMDGGTPKCSTVVPRGGQESSGEVKIPTAEQGDEDPSPQSPQ